MSESIFETPRLRVRNLRDSDFAAFHEMQADDNVMKYTSDDGNGCGLSEATNREQLSGCIEAYGKPDNQFWVWAMENLDSEFVGTCAIVKNEKDEHEIGYRLLSRFWGQGFGREICDPLIRYGLDRIGCQAIVAYVDVRNVASVKILDASVLNFECEIQNGDVRDRKYWIEAGSK